MHTQKEHRQRVKARFQEEGLDHFDPVHALELLLFYAIPQKDTKPAARALLDRFGSYTAVLEATAAEFPKFLAEIVPGNPMKAEYFLPKTVGQYMKAGKATVQVLRSADKWYGVTYAADKPIVVAALSQFTAEGKYPDSLWG